MSSIVTRLRSFFRPYARVVRAKAKSVERSIKQRIRPYVLETDLHPDLRRTGALLTLAADGPLGKAGDRLLLPNDKIISPQVISVAAWDHHHIDNFCTHLDAEKSYTLLDIGANIGLFSRQLQLRVPNLARIICVEPDQANFSALRYNLHPLAERVEFHNIALGDSDAERDFFRDAENIGNYSLNPDAMRDRTFDTATVTVRETTGWMTKSLQSSTALLWKSDTQGFDEVIVSATPMSIWQRIDVALIEIWRIAKPDFDHEAFRLRLDSFPNRQLDEQKGVSAQDVLDYLSGDDYQHKDLLMWR